MKTTDISLQLYTTRNFQPYEKILQFVSKIGITNIELFGLENINTEEFKKIKEDFQISFKSSHFSFEALKDTSNIIGKAKDLNVKHLIVPAPPIKGNSFEDQFSMNESEWVSFGKELSSYITVFTNEGLTLGYHNHSFEFIPLESQKLPIECVMDQNENLKFEIDIGWAIAGGADPKKWIERYSEKIVACHLKDFFDSENNMLDHENQTTVGSGFINWKDIISDMHKTNCELFILEHDDPKDYKNYITDSMNNLLKI